MYARNNINKEWRDRVEGWVTKDIPDSIMEEIKYRYLIEKEQFREHEPFVKRAFSRIG